MTEADKVGEQKKFKDSYADVNGIRLHYVSSGQGKLIIFLHGFPEFWAEWEDQLAEFGKDHQAVAVDLRGYNLSSKPAGIEQYSVKHIANDVKSLAEHLGHTRFILVAHDWGGGIAWFFANRHPELLERLIIINSPHPAVFARELLNNPEQRAASQYMLLFRKPDAEQVLSQNGYEYLFQALTGGQSRWKMSEKERKRYNDAWSQPGALTGGLNYYRVSPVYPPVTPDDEKRLKAIIDMDRAVFAVNVPTLVIWGEQDTALTIGNLNGLKDYVSDLVIERVPDGSHWVVKEQPALVNSLMRKFIAARK